jgi:hypothetical protein
MENRVIVSTTPAGEKDRLADRPEGSDWPARLQNAAEFGASTGQFLVVTAANHPIAERGVRAELSFRNHRFL